jgi:hypothetical protein
MWLCDRTIIFARGTDVEHDMEMLSHFERHSMQDDRRCLEGISRLNRDPGRHYDSTSISCIVALEFATCEERSTHFRDDLK